MHSYKHTLKQFIERYNAMQNNVGIIGELLFHIIIKMYFSNFRICSVLFNMENRGFKNGYDVIIENLSNKELITAEVKSGKKNENKDSNQTISTLINDAKKDLNVRLNGSYDSLWIEAMNGFKKSISECDDDYDILKRIIDGNYCKAVENKLDSTEQNVFLVGVLFNNTDDIFEEETISNIEKELSDAKIFKNVYIFAIQDNAYSEVIEFLLEESKNE